MREYKLYYKENKKRVYFDFFSAESDEKAINAVDEKMKDKVFVDAHGQAYWDYGDSINECDETGKIIKSWDSTEDMFNDMKEDEKKWWFGKKIYYWFVRKMNYYRPWFNIKLGFERMFKGYDRRVSWSIDTALADLLRYAIPTYIENMHGCPNSYCEQARKILSGMTDDEVRRSYEKDPNSTDKELEVGMAIYKADLRILLNNLNLLDYYDSYGIQETDSKNWVDPVKYPIPHLKNSEVIDYRKLSELEEKTLDEVFTYLRQHIREMWD